MNKSMLKIGFTLLLLHCNILFAQEEINPEWSQIVDATHGDMVRDLWVTPQGESYMFGDITALDDGSFDHQGMMLIKHSASGEEIWRKYIHGATADWKTASRGISGDSAGNIYIIYDEYRDVPFNTQRVAAKKYDADGIEIWSHFYTSEVDNVVEELVTGSFFLKDNYLYATGTLFTTEAIFQEFVTNGFVYKIDITSGSAIKMIFDSQYQGIDYLLESKVDNAGNVYSIGRSNTTPGDEGLFSAYDAVLVKFDAWGNKVWEHFLNGQADDEDFGISLAIDPQGNVYTSCQLKKINIPEREVVVQKISPSGNVIWTYNYQGADTGDLWRQPVEVLPNGNLALVISNLSGIVTKVINGVSGTEVWSNNYNRNNMGFSNHHRDMIIDALGNIYITGTTKTESDPGASKDIVTLKYNNQGELLWVSNFDHTDYFNFGDDGVTLALDGAGNVYTVGWVYQTGANAEFALLKYGDAVMKVKDISKTELKVYPNPVVDNAYISISDDNSLEKAILYDMNGRLIKNWDKEALIQFSGRLDLQELDKGMYMLTIHSENGLSSLKIYKQ